MEEKESEKCRVAEWDLKDTSTTKELVGECRDKFGRIDVWVNYEGYSECNGTEGDFFSVSEDEWDIQMSANCEALYFITQEAGRYFRDNGIAGHIVQVFNSGGDQSVLNPCGISKRLAMEFTRGIAKALARYHVVVNGVAFDNAMEDEIADMVAFLASDMADHMIGNIFECNVERFQGNGYPV